ncbi:uncharacterized protein N7477_009946 [Penicillium maclennaniae]|uniref:uncharacterized protein n=1 Tax=Penicillium maclennaniae TaxID=1343394 RepID=UPI002541129C|nr:uncharacterized protein N7477_009946 [Penicillium maclennaniae]KAJ5662330.1 hypothetical protein N7477_009946 [Penicillium maclennaniae]
MFRTASRRISSAPRLLPAQRQPTIRSICNQNTRPGSQPRYKNVKSLANSSFPRSRYLTYAQRLRMNYREASKGIFRKNPVMLPLAIISVIGGLCLFTYISYVELTQVAPQYHNFPQPVAESLRSAVYYTEIDLNPIKALNSYKEALRRALDLGMHPFSDEVMGIKLQVALMLEKAGLVKASVEVLERTRTETMKWIEEGRAAETPAGKEDAKLSASAKATPDNVQIKDGAIQEAEEELKKMQAFEARQRDKALKKVVGMEMKLAELYSSDHIQEDKKAEAAQVAAVELCLKEMHRRQKLGLPVGGGSGDANSDAWLNMTEIATALAELASTYTAKDRHELAMPLYLRALELLRVAEGDSPSCKQVTLLNDVASAMAGQVQLPASRRAEKQAISREQTIEAARQWAQKSLDVAARIQPPVRDEECDITCVVATYNLGELAELQNKPDVAKQRYIEAKSLASGLGYEDGVAMADAALKRFSKK